MKYLTQKILKEALADYEQIYKEVIKMSDSSAIKILYDKNMENGLCYYFVRNYYIDTYFKANFMNSKLGRTPSQTTKRKSEALLTRIEFLKSLIKQ